MHPKENKMRPFPIAKNDFCVFKSSNMVPTWLNYRKLAQHPRQTNERTKKMRTQVSFICIVRYASAANIRSKKRSTTICSQINSHTSLNVDATGD